mgnify:CR=1 FL=1
MSGRILKAGVVQFTPKLLGARPAKRFLVVSTAGLALWRSAEAHAASVVAKVISAFTKKKVSGIKAGGFNASAGELKDHELAAFVEPFTHDAPERTLPGAPTLRVVDYMAFAAALAERDQKFVDEKPTTTRAAARTT